MRTPLTVATGLVLLAGVVVGVTTPTAAADDAPAVAPIRVEAPPVPGAVADVDPAGPVLPESVAPVEVAPQEAAPQDAVPQPAQPEAQQPEAQQPVPRLEPQAPRDPNGFVAPPPADDDDDDDDDDDADEDDEDDDGDGDDD